MRKFIPALMILVATSAQAVEVKFGDLNYNMSEGEQNFQFDFGTLRAKQVAENSDSTIRAYMVKSEYRYALTDKFDAFIGLEYVWQAQINDGGAKTLIDSFRNPALGASYRIFDQKDFAYNFDVEVVTKQSLFKAKNGGDTANMYQGRSTYELYGKFGKKWNEANEWEAGFGMIYNADGKAEQNGTKYDEESSTDLEFKLGYQYRPVNEFMINLSAEALYVGEFQYAKNIKEDGHLDFTFGFGAKYLITENLIGRFQFNQSRLSDFDYKNAGVKASVDSRHFNVYGAGIDYLF